MCLLVRSPTLGGCECPKFSVAPEKSYGSKCATDLFEPHRPGGPETSQLMTICDFDCKAPLGKDPRENGKLCPLRRKGSGADCWLKLYSEDMASVATGSIPGKPCSLLK